MIAKRSAVSLGLLCSALLSLSGCTTLENTADHQSHLHPILVTSSNSLSASPTLHEKQATYLQQFAFSCITEEYPNKLNQVLGDRSDLKSPKQLHPAFYGCFDWHSSVHGHWTLVTLLKQIPNLANAEEIHKKLKQHLTQKNLAKELSYFLEPHNQSFERTYGWVWLFKLDEALRTWEHPDAPRMRQHLQPLTLLLENRLIEFLQKLQYPVRSGQHPNTAFALSFAYDYAQQQNRVALLTAIEASAKRYYLQDKRCPISWEPSGFDFLSACLQEASLMQKILTTSEFETWVETFLPSLLKHGELILTPALVSDRSDGKLAHLDGLNFSRAWSLYELGHALNNPKLVRLANIHFNASYQKMDSGEYAGAHWLASFALYAMQKHQQGMQLAENQNNADR